MQKQEKGIVFNIQRFSLHDGPGIRTIVFLKGCPLRCKWCSNPESQELKPVVTYRKSSCNKCYECISACPQKAITPTEDGIKIDRTKCDNLLECVDSCAPGALKIEGREVTVDEVVEEVMKDEAFYRTSGGGITLSGGEILMQHSFAVAILKAIKEKGISTAIETTGYGNWNHLQTVLEYTDYVLYDLKHTDENMHKEGTGVGLSLILDNLTRVAESGKNLTVRMPIIPEFNMNEKHILKAIEILKKLNRNEVHILPFHQFGKQKYEYLGREYELENLRTPTDEEMESIKQMFEENGINAFIGG